MKLEWMMLANHAEDRGGLLYISGGTWDTLNIQAPLEGGPPGAVAVLLGVLIIRLGSETTEIERDHTFSLTVMGEDGQQLATIGGEFRVTKAVGLPPGWEQGTNIIVGMNGLPLPSFGLYSILLQVDDKHVGERPFRVLKLY